MKRENRQGPVVMGKRAPLAELAAEDVAAALAADEIGVVDTRHHSLVHEGTVVGALNIPAGNKAASYGAWAVDPQTDKRPLVLLAPGGETATEMWDHLIRVGIDNVAGYITSLDGLPVYTPATLAPADLAGFEVAMLLDVRNKTEYSDGHIPGSEQLNAGRVLWHTDQLPADGAIVSYCQSGVRNSVAASALRRAGHNVVELTGSYAGWNAWKQAQDA